MKKTNKILLYGTLPFILVIGSGYIYVKSSGTDNSKPSDIQDGSIALESLENDTSSEKEQNTSKDFKSSLPSASTKNNDQESSLKTVVPTITSLEQTDNYVEVSSRVPGIFENSGTCELILSKNTKEVKKTQMATPNVSEMSCGFMKISRSNLTPGNWDMYVSYSSKKASGSSEYINIEVN